MRQSRTCLTVCLLLAASLSLVSACATTDTSSFPPSADLQRTAKPRLDPAKIGSEAYLDEADIAREEWGDGSYAALGRLCLFFKRKGMKVDCEPEPNPFNGPR